MDAYQKGPIIGEGTYGSVFCATHKASGRKVAIKKVRMCNGKDGINMSVLRELKALKALKSPHVVELLDVFTTKNNLVLVFDHMEWSLEDVIREKSIPLSAADIKSYMQMMLQGLAFVHEQEIAHRDIKPDNLLIGGDMVLMLADFGLARSLYDSSESSKLTPQVFGRWYRPPELLMGCNNYGTAVDMWAAGCVLAELLLRKPWFPGVCDMDQLDRIFKALGVPTVDSWPGLADLPHRIDFKPAHGKPLKELFPQATPDCLDLLKQLMQFHPQRRITAAAALQHHYFSSEPPPTPPGSLPRPATSRAGRRNAAAVPALVHDMLMQPALMLRQQQQDCSSVAASFNSSSSRQLFAFAGHNTSFSGRFIGGVGLQAGLPSGAENSLGGYSGNSNVHMSSCSRLYRGGSNGSDQLGSTLDDGPSLPWKGRLSFGSIADEPVGPAAAEQQQEQQQQHQQQGYKRPSPMQQQQQHGKAGSMRPPLHRNSLAGLHGTTPLPARPGSAGAAAASSGDTQAPAAAAGGAGVGKRRVSDLAASLSTAAASTMDGLSGLEGVGSFLAQGRHLQQQQQVQAGIAAECWQGFPAATPAAGLAAAQPDNTAAATTAMDDADIACPMSLSTGAQKRSRAVFEAQTAAGQPGMQQQGSEAERMQEQQQQQQPAAMGIHGSMRRILRGRRSSMGSGCCSMETDGAPPSSECGGYQQQHCPRQQQHFHSHSTQVPGVSAPIQHLGSISSQLFATANAGVDKQQDLQALLVGHHHQQQQQRGQMQHGRQQQLLPSANSMQQGAGSSLLLQLQHPWPINAAGAPQGKQQPDEGLSTTAAAAVPPSGLLDTTGGRDVESGLAQLPHTTAMGQQQDALQDCSAQQPDSDGCPMSLDQRTGTAQANGHSHIQRGHYTAASGMKSGCSSVGPCTGAAAEGLDLHALDPAELAEMAAWWRPRLDSAERRYLRCRKLQMDEALLQASQHDGEELLDNTFGSPGFCARGALFGSPLGVVEEQQPPGVSAAARPVLSQVAGAAADGELAANREAVAQQHAMKVAAS